MCDLSDNHEDSKIQICPVCDGKGFEIENEFVGAPDEQVECLKCGGSGVVDYTQDDIDADIDREADLLRD